MQIGDKVQVLGTVRDIVEKSVLVVTEDHMNQREYWFLAEHVTLVEAAPTPPLEAEQLPVKPPPPHAAQLPAEEPEEPAHPAHPVQRPGVPPVRPAPTPVGRK